MEILGCGEDALTLWSLKHRHDFFQASLRDSSDNSKCQAFFWPSFGRSGGNKSSQFGEFDFNLLAEKSIYLIGGLPIKEWPAGSHSAGEPRAGANGGQERRAVFPTAAYDRQLTSPQFHIICFRTR